MVTPVPTILFLSLSPYLNSGFPPPLLTNNRFLHWFTSSSGAEKGKELTFIICYQPGRYHAWYSLYIILSNSSNNSNMGGVSLRLGKIKTLVQSKQEINQNKKAKNGKARIKNKQTEITIESYGIYASECSYLTR